MRAFSLGRALLLGLSLAVTLGSVAAPAHAQYRRYDNRRVYRRRPVYAPRYYAPPPVAYGTPYYAPPPVVYGPGIGINLPGFSVNIR